jgi:hypothetical protein
MSEEKTSTQAAAAAVAARRRAKKTGSLPPPLPETPSLPEPVAEPDPAQAEIQTGPTGAVVVASGLIAEFAAQTHNGLTSARLPSGAMGVPARLPLVQPTSTMYGRTPHADNYAVAEFDAHESMVPAMAKQPVSRLLWRKGWRVRKDFYEEVCKRRSPADQEAALMSPAGLPEGVTDPPAEFVAETASPASGAPA